MTQLKVSLSGLHVVIEILEARCVDLKYQRCVPINVTANRQPMGERYTYSVLEHRRRRHEGHGKGKCRVPSHVKASAT